MVGKKKAKLTPKQKRFCKEYMIDLNLTQAAVRAGYSKKSAQRISMALIIKSHVAEYIQKLMDKRSKETEIEANRVINELAKLAFANMKHYAKFGPDGVQLTDSEELTDDQLAAISEVSETETKDGGTKRFKLHDKLKALELLGRHLGIFEKDKTPVNVNIGVMIDDMAPGELEAEGKRLSRLLLSVET